ncbi:aspartate kinase [Photobacterium sanguinicancri]|uniref:Aspartokinase n=1 Tax=Photobacterium sanguinicancri TaxID=875932 RepID=A0ABX4FYY9_9GAMM|nr:aspartate kinase [Photobacterium sanguinicancri]KXI20974.1 aspartate kinase [Photobacterium sanguinicancri]OZS44112.1 aspartate kinase [Photobacterium sanguinicancri]
MALLVQKFGGTSVGSIERIEAVAERVIQTRQLGHKVVVVLSAMSGETNRLLGLAKQIDEVPTPRELDVLLTAGEQVSIALLAMAINKRGFNAVSMTADQVTIRTDNAFNNANIISIDTDRLESQLEQGKIVIVAGFQGRDSHNNITTLGRGGSDTTAVAVAGALKADECQIFTDVDGVYTTDPRIVPSAARLPEIHFDHMQTMAACGAKVLQLQSVEYARMHKVPLRVLSSFEEGEGTLVNFETQHSPVMVGIALQRQQALIHIDVPLAELQQQVDLFGLQVWAVTNTAQSAQIVVANDDLARLRLVFDNKMRHISDVSTLSMVGDNVVTVAEAVVTTLSNTNIQVHHNKQMTDCVSLLINEADHQTAVEVIHRQFVVNQELLGNPSLLAVS